MRSAIGKDQPVNAKLPIVDLIAKVAAVRPVRRALVVVFGDALIHPVPNKATLQTLVGSEGVPIVGEVTEAVAHGMSVLTENNRPRLFFARYPVS